MPKWKNDPFPLFYEVCGSGNPLLLIAGLGADNSCWAGIVKNLSKHFKIIVFDNQGSGRSPLLNKKLTIRQMADDAVKLLDHLGIKRSHLIGHSMGGYIAQEIAIYYPERVNKLILEGTAPVSSVRNNELFADFAHKLQKKDNFEQWIKNWTNWLFSPQTFASGGFIENFIKLATKYPYLSTAKGFKAQVDAMVKFNTRNRLSKIKAKTLIVEGDEDILIRPDEAWELANHIKGCVLKLINNCAHYVHLENPSLFCKMAIQFLGK
ncbi:MAG: alpha/beta hydrolase [Candidatus Margulisiibacteriota bacterium]